MLHGWGRRVTGWLRAQWVLGRWHTNEKECGRQTPPEAGCYCPQQKCMQSILSWVFFFFFPRPVASSRPDSSSPPAESCYPHKTPLFWKTPSAGCRLSSARRIVYKYPYGGGYGRRERLLLAAWFWPCSGFSMLVSGWILGVPRGPGHDWSPKAVRSPRGVRPLLLLLRLPGGKLPLEKKKKKRTKIK